ncbi:MAG TPA: ATP-dependent Clp protease proteolytic subunit, partial [Candidatus Limnocylindrales bacterium]
AVLLAAGAPGKRFALPHARIMIHQGSGGFRGNTPDVFIQVKEMETLVNTNHEILAHHTKQPLEKIVADTSRDYFMSPPEAKDYGIIDAVYASIGAPLGSKGGGTAGTDTVDTSEGPSTEKGPEAATE